MVKSKKLCPFHVEPEDTLDDSGQYDVCRQMCREDCALYNGACAFTILAEVAALWLKGGRS